MPILINRKISQLGTSLEWKNGPHLSSYCKNKSYTLLTTLGLYNG